MCLLTFFLKKATELKKRAVLHGEAALPAIYYPYRERICSACDQRRLLTKKHMNGTVLTTSFYYW
jgi:hypothetical protein